MNTQDFKRKLTAVFSADVAGYSRLMGENESATVKTLEAYKQVMFSLIKQHRGRVIDSPGDNMLAEFVSVVDAVQCGVAVQNELKARNSDLPENRKMQFRIGINLGDVIEEGDRIYGDGVNIAARLEALSDPGGICVSKTAFDHIEAKLPLGYHFLGEQMVKNIAKPVGAYKVLMEPRVTGAERKGKAQVAPVWRRKSVLAGAMAVLIVLIGGTVWNFYWRAPKFEPASISKMAFPLPEKPSIAVLPFVNMSDDPKQEFFNDALTEDIITSLSKMPNIFVVARNSTFTYKGKPVKVQRVAEDLGVRYVLEGSVQISGDRVRITAQLIDALKGYHVWSDRYDREMKDIFALQDKITLETLKALDVKLSRGDVSRVHGMGTDNLEAYIKLLQGREIFQHQTRESNIQARQLFEEVIRLDPNYAIAYFFLSAVTGMDVAHGISKSPRESQMKAIELDQKAISLDDSCASAYAHLGYLYALIGEYEKGIAAGERAIEIAPNFTDAYVFFAAVLNTSGRSEEAIPVIEKAFRLNPLNPPFSHYTVAARTYYLVGRYEDAIRWSKELLSRWPNNIFGHQVLVLTNAALGRDDEARAAAQNLLRIQPDFSTQIYARHFPHKDLARDLELLRKAGLRDKPALPLPDKPSIAVLPFQNMTGDPQQEYFGDGMADQLITGLSQSPDIYVTSRTSSFTYKGKSVTAQQIADQLGVRYLLEGGFQRDADRVRINVQIIDGQNGNHLWAQRYDSKFEDLFALQDQITMEAMEFLNVKFMAGFSGTTLSASLKHYRPSNLKAYESYTKGVYHFHRRTPKDSIAARQLFEETINLDSEFAVAYSSLGLAYLDEVWFRITKSPEKSIEQAEQMAQKTIALTPDQPPPYNLLSFISRAKKDYDNTVLYAEKALESSPKDTSGYYILGSALLSAGRYEEAIVKLETALRLVPVPPLTYVNNLAWSYLGNKQYDKAILLWTETLERNPDYIFGFVGLAAAYELSGTKEKARWAAENVMRVSPEFSIAAWQEMFSLKDEAFWRRFSDACRSAGLK